MLMTATDGGCRDDPRALLLARKAVESRRCHAWLDILAYAYFQNGDTEGAIRTETEALGELRGENPYSRDLEEKYLKRLRYYREDQAP